MAHSMTLPRALLASACLHGMGALTLGLLFTGPSPDRLLTAPLSLGNPGVVAKTPSARPRPSAALQAEPRVAATTATATAAVSDATRPSGVQRNAYAQRVLAALQERQIYPALARSRGDVGLVEVTLTVGREGDLRIVEILKSSGVPALDEAALALVQGLPTTVLRLPEEIPGPTLTLTVPLRYLLH